MPSHSARLSALLDLIDGDAYLALNYEYSDHATLRYLTGFTGEGALLVAPGGSVLLTDSRYTEQAKAETDGLEIDDSRAWRSTSAAEAIKARKLDRVVFPSTRSTYQWVEDLSKLGDFTLVPEKDPVSTLRRVKTADELKALRRAAAIADKALDALINELKVGMTEAEAALRLEVLIRETDAEGIAFSVNASAGPNTALNHYNPSLAPQPLREGDLLLFDFGACCDGYRSDMTRTIAIGASEAKGREIYEIVLAANLAAIDVVASGRTGVEIDAVARNLIAEAGYGDFFGHGLGHGIGLEVHEAPGLSPKSEDTLEPGMVVTIEPGIYIPGFGGVRIEDDVIVGEDGCEVITTFPKDRLLEVG